MTPELRLACAFCGRACTDALTLRTRRALGHSCPSCAARLGRILLDAPHTLGAIWPVLVRGPGADPDDEVAPEPKVTLPDGRLVELRERTAELKQDLPLAARLQLAGTYGELGLHREQLVECGFVLAAEPGDLLSAQALAVLFAHPACAADALDRLRAVLFPS